VKLSNSVKQRFCKDFNMPFQVVQEPMFSYYIEQLDKHFDTKAKLKMLIEVIETLGGEEQFFAESNRVKTVLIDKITKTKKYISLQNDKLDDYNTSHNVSQRDIYTMQNINHTFMSLDLVQANFNVFKMYSDELVLGFDTYADLVGSVSQFEYFKKSKYLRQVIFGNLQPKKQQRLQKFVMDNIITVLNSDVGIDMKDFVAASADEVVFSVDPSNVDMFVEMINRKIRSNPLSTSVANWVKVEAFTLKSISSKKFFVKELSSGGVEFKGIQSYFFMQAYKQYTQQPIEKMDKTFYHDGMLATFDKTVFDEQELVGGNDDEI